MTEQNTAGQGAAPTGTSDNVGLLKAQLAEAKLTITRLTGTQSANDRALTTLRTEKATLVQQLEEAKASSVSVTTDLEASRTQNTALSERLEELAPFEGQVTQKTLEADQLRVAAVLAGKSPAISLLVKSNALPSADTVEGFEAALTEIASGLGEVIGSAARDQLSGTRPPNVHKDTNDPDTMEELAMSLMNEGKTEEGLTLYTKALNLRAKTA